ncbi:MAG: hypothetical protein J1F17_00995 [Oscillospiraceae bacterium]|nr:hypothetical protein [Oscillospiraceae bacterium]
MSIFYPEELIIYSLSVNSFLPFDVKSDILAKVRKNFFEHNRRQCDKLVQNIGEVSLNYTYNLEKNRPMKWIVKKNKKTIEDAVIVSVNSYELRTYNENGDKLISTEYTNDHIFKMLSFSHNNDAVVISAGIENNQPVLYYREGNNKYTLYLLEINEDEEVLTRLSEKNPYISVTALTNKGLVYFGSQEEISNINCIIDEIKDKIVEENTPKSYITQEDKKSGFNFNDNDFNIKKNMNQTYDVGKVEYFTDDPEDIEENHSLEKINILDNVYENQNDVQAEIENISDNISNDNALNDKNSENVEVTEPSVDNPVNKTEEFETKTEEIEDKEEDSETANPPVEEVECPVDNSTEEIKFDDNSGVIEDVEDNNNSVEENSRANETQELNKEFIEKIILEKIAEALEGVSLATSKEEKIDFANKLDVDSILADYANTGETSSESVDDVSVEEEQEIRDNRNVRIADLIINSGGERYLYFGELNDNLLRDGYGRTEMSNGKTAYEGNYKDNKRSGFGSFYYRDGGLCYCGEWKDNKREGFGIGIRSSDNSFHTGGWSDNKPQGIGARFDKYGNLSYVSNYENGKEKGLSVQFNSDGSVTVFKWQNDEKKIIETIFP